MASTKSLAVSSDLGWWDSLFPRRREDFAKKKAINGNIKRLEQTAHDIREEHRLEELLEGIEMARAQGNLAMDSGDHGRPSKP